MKRKLFHQKLFCNILIYTSILLIPVLGITQQKLEFPNKPIEITCGYGAGGSTDITLRALSRAAEKYLAQSIVVINKPGAGTVIALHLVMDSKPDGYSLVNLSYSAAAITPHLKKVRYNPARDFTPIMQYGGNIYTLVVRTDASWNTIKEFIEYSKKNPGVVSIGSTGAAAQNIPFIRLAKAEGIQWNFVPFDATRDSIVACLGGHITAAAGEGSEAPFVRDGKLKMLANLMDKRSEGFPNVPTLIESGYNYAGKTMVSIVGPKGIPEEIVKKLSNAFKYAMSDPAFIKIMKNLEQDIIYRNSEELKEYIEKISNENADIKEVLGLGK